MVHTEMLVECMPYHGLSMQVNQVWKDLCIAFTAANLNLASEVGLLISGLPRQEDNLDV